jgi:hypothetical protein
MAIAKTKTKPDVMTGLGDVKPLRKGNPPAGCECFSSIMSFPCFGHGDQQCVVASVLP